MPEFTNKSIIAIGRNNSSLDSWLTQYQAVLWVVWI